MTSRSTSLRPSPPSAPDLLEAVIGWRVWRIDARHRLRSALRDELWEPRRPLVAACEVDHAAPDQRCDCGIYAVRRPEHARAYLVGRNRPEAVHRVLGRVALWGRVVECEQGWRAQYAYPARIWVPDCAEAGSVAPPANRGACGAEAGSVAGKACGAPGAFEIAFELGRYGVPVELVAGHRPTDVVLAARAAEPLGSGGRLGRGGLRLGLGALFGLLAAP